MKKPVDLRHITISIYESSMCVLEPNRFRITSREGVDSWSGIVPLIVAQYLRCQ